MTVPDKLHYTLLQISISTSERKPTYNQWGTLLTTKHPAYLSGMLF